MAFHEIPKKFDIKEIVADLKTLLLYSDDIEDGVIGRMAKILGCSKRSVYAVLSGDIKLTLDFMHAAVIATSGNPQVRKYLEPDGFFLSKVAEVSPDKATRGAECADDLEKVAVFHKLVNQEPRAPRAKVLRAKEEAILELEETYARYDNEG